MFKKLVSLSLALTLFIALTTAASAQHSYNCNTPPSAFCENRVLEKGDKVGYSNSMYLLQGMPIYYSIWTESTSVWQMGVELEYSAAGPTGPWATVSGTLKIASGGGNNNGGIVNAPLDGYYRVKVMSGDNINGNSRGEGSLTVYP